MQTINETVLLFHSNPTFTGFLDASLRTCAAHFAIASPAAVLGTDRRQISFPVFVYGYNDAREL